MFNDMKMSRSSVIKLLVAASFVILLSQVTAIFLPLIIAVVATFVLHPLVKFFCRPIGKWEMPVPLAVILSFITATLVLVFLGTLIVVPIASEFSKFVLNLPKLMSQIQALTLSIGQGTDIAYLPEGIQSMVRQIMAVVTSFFVGLASKMVNGIFSFANKITELVVVPVLVYYFLTDWQTLHDGIVSIFPERARKGVSAIIAEMSQVISSYIRGQALISVIIGTLVAVGMYWLDVEYPLVLGLVATLTETIPIVGPIIGAMPAIFLAYLISPVLAVKTALFYIVIHQLENHIIVPNIMGHTIDLHPVVIIFSLLVGGQLLGIVGMILAVPVAALLRVLYKHLW